LSGREIKKLLAFPPPEIYPFLSEDDLIDVRMTGGPVIDFPDQGVGLPLKNRHA
jgi:hypothetical protein